VVPSYLYHPISFVEIRDVPLVREPGRPVTPLWKMFRWKDWAMKKGLIPSKYKQLYIYIILVSADNLFSFVLC
jgi:hypothetical protein